MNDSRPKDSKHTVDASPSSQNEARRRSHSNASIQRNDQNARQRSSLSRAYTQNSNANAEMLTGLIAEPMVYKSQPLDNHSTGVLPVQGQALRARETYTKPSAVILLGSTGTGKSSFVRSLTGMDVSVGETLKSCTAECSTWQYQSPTNDHVTLVDTPGFNDTDRPDLEILQSIADFIARPSSPRICSVLFLHRIDETRLTGSSRLTLNVLRLFCGQVFFPNVTIATTMWNTLAGGLDLAKFDAREWELSRSAGGWGDFTQRGTKTERYLGTRESAARVLQNILHGPDTPQFATEISNGVLFADTRAGMLLVEELRRKEEMMRREHEEEMAEIEREQQALRARFHAENQRSESMQYRQGGQRVPIYERPDARFQAAGRFTSVPIDPSGGNPRPSLRADIRSGAEKVDRFLNGRTR